MQIEIKIDEKCKEPKIIVMTDKMTDEVNAIIKRLSDEQPQVIAGFREDVVEVLEPSEIYRVFAESGKVFAETNYGEYALRLRLYEAEQRLDSKTFVRISNSDIINLRKVKSFDLSFVDGFFYPVTPELVNKMGSELNAVLIQTGLSGIMGTGFAMASVIWEIDSWSLAKQSGIYFAIACVIMFPISYFANWIPHSTAGILSYVGIFVAIFLAAWVTQYSVWKRKIKKMNEGIKDNNDMN